MFQFLNVQILNLHQGIFFKWNEKQESIKQSIYIGRILFQVFVM